MVAIAILHYCNVGILLAHGIWRSETHHSAKFHQNQSIHYGDIAIFRFLKMATVCHLVFVWITFAHKCMKFINCTL